MSDGALKRQAFVIQHVGAPGSETRQRADLIMERLILPACTVTGYAPVRDHQVPAELIAEPIVSSLSTSPLVIADLGSPPWNENVLMEIGFRLATGRPIVFLADVEPNPKELPLHLQNRRILAVNTAAPTEDDVQKLSNYITRQQREIYGWRSHYPIIEFTVPLENPNDARFVFANDAAVRFYGFDQPEELLATSIVDADARLKDFMPASHREPFSKDQDTMFVQVLSPMNRLPAMANVPAWFTNHPQPSYNYRMFWPILLQHKFSPHRDNSIVMRVAFVDVSSWDAQGPDGRDVSNAVKIPDVFRERRFRYDVFLSYNSKDFETVKELADALGRFGLSVWFDEDDLVGQRGLFPELICAMSESRIIAAVYGKNGLGPWQTDELGTHLLDIARGGKSFAILLLNDLPTGKDEWLRGLPAAFKAVFKDRLFARLPPVDVFRQLLRDPTRPLGFIERVVDILASALHPKENSI